MVITQRDATNRALSEVQARNAYVHARINMDSALGRVLQVHDVNLDDAKNGVVGRPADMIPAVPPPSILPAVNLGRK